MLKNIDWEKWNDKMYSLHPTPYHSILAGVIERRRVSVISRLAQIKNDDIVLEIGCEQGLLLKSLPDCKQKVGLDISTKILKAARKVLGKKTILIKADAQNTINLGTIKPTTIICSQTLEHVMYPEKIMDNIKKLSYKQTRIVISVPNELFMLKIKTFLKSIRVINWLLPGIEDHVSEWHLQIFTDKKVRELVEKNFHIKKSIRVFNIYLVYLLEIK